MAKAEAADATPLEDGLSIPEEIEWRQQRKAKLVQNLAEMEARALVRVEAERPKHASKSGGREAQR